MDSCVECWCPAVFYDDAHVWFCRWHVGHGENERAESTRDQAV